MPVSCYAGRTVHEKSGSFSYALLYEGKGMVGWGRVEQVRAGEGLETIGYNMIIYHVLSSINIGKEEGRVGFYPPILSAVPVLLPNLHWVGLITPRYPPPPPPPPPPRAQNTQRHL